MDKEDTFRIAALNIEEGERWHKKVNLREIVFGFNDGSISTERDTHIERVSLLVIIYQIN